MLKKNKCEHIKRIAGLYENVLASSVWYMLLSQGRELSRVMMTCLSLCFKMRLEPLRMSLLLITLYLPRSRHYLMSKQISLSSIKYAFTNKLVSLKRN